MRILSVFGTRPEAIKMAPVIKELSRHSGRVDSLVCVTAQHREMLDQVLDLFHIRPDFDLDLMRDNQPLPALAARAIAAVGEVLERAKPDMVLVQGDTTTAMAGALASFYQRVPAAHIEAGLRTGNRMSPFPEEINRRLVGTLAAYHFAPTSRAAEALRGEGVPDENIFVTGNTVIDALLWTVSQPLSIEASRYIARFGICSLNNILENGNGSCKSNGADRPRLILVTAHRRENFGRALEGICGALRVIVKRNPGVEIVYPVHRNPNVREPVYRILDDQERIHLLEPLPYGPFAFLMNQAYLILTDSGGIQEEAPTLGKPVLVMRRETERPEAVSAGTVKVIGVEPRRIVEEAEHYLNDRRAYEEMARAANPYGDGHAAERIVEAILEIHGVRGRRSSRETQLETAGVRFANAVGSVIGPNRLGRWPKPG